MPPYDIPPKIVYEEGGGINTGTPPSEIESNERVVIENFFALGKKLIRRGGIRKITSYPFLDEVMSILPFRSGSGMGLILAGRATNTGQYDYGRLAFNSTAPTTIGKAADVYNVTTKPMFQYNGIIYALAGVTGAATPLHRIDTAIPFVQTAGIVAPVAACTIAAGAAGVLAAGNYQAVYTYFNSATGVESNPSPASTVLTLGAGGLKINYTVIADPPAGINQITGKRVYRTLINQVGEYYYVGTVALGVTTLTEELLPAEMGDPVLFDNNTPPLTLTWVAPWNERCFGTDGIDLFMTNLFTMEGWTNEVIPVFKDDGHYIRVLYSWKDRLIVGKSNKVHFLTGTDRSTFRLFTLSDKVGCTAPLTMKSVGNYLFWFGGRDIYMSDGSNVIPIGEKVRAELDAIPEDWTELMTAAVLPSLSQYIVAIPNINTANEWVNSTILVYNYLTGIWTKYNHPNVGGVQYMTEYLTTDSSGVLGATGVDAVYASQYLDGNIYHLYDRTRNSDEDATTTLYPIPAKVLTRQEDGGSLMAKALRRVHLLCTTAAEVITLKAYRDGRAVPSASRDVSLNVDSAWKVANLSTLRDPGSTVQLGIEYTGTTAIEIEAEGLEIEPVERFSGQPQ